MNDWKSAIEAEWNRRHAPTVDGPLFPLMNPGFGTAEIVAAVETLLSGRVTMGERVREFERQFAEFVGAPYAVMVNSGSSANLLAVSVCANPARERRLVAGDEVLVPAVCWSTSVWPLIQCGLRPVFVDVDPETLNLSIEDLERRITSKTRAIMMIHVLGNSAPIAEAMAIARQHDLIVIEDTCESLGAAAGDRMLGAHGDFGTFSFYYSHHITTGEGGMVVCHTAADADLLRCLRAHGWTRELAGREEVEVASPDIDPRFNFVNLGYNLRPLEVQAAFGIIQLARIREMNRVRNENRHKIIAAMTAHPLWSDQYSFTRASTGTSPAWFGFTLLSSGERDVPALLRTLTSRGVENRPVISGNFARQPALRLLGLEIDPRDYPGAEAVHSRGFFIGLHSTPLSDSLVEQLADVLLTS